ncbi:MAG: hypothetical protein QOK64_07775, partial [Nitrososphaeraceae archaeon]|nr:hypothetical protein [Nitrososphaeraceae archaeon]
FSCRFPSPPLGPTSCSNLGRVVGSSKTPRSFRLALGPVASFSASVRPGGMLALAFTFSHFQVSSFWYSHFHIPPTNGSSEAQTAVSPTVIQLVTANTQMWTNYKLLQQIRRI